MYGWAITCSETSSSLGVSHAGLAAGLVLRAAGGTACWCRRSQSIRSSCLPFVELDVGNWHPLPVVRLRVGRLVVDRAHAVLLSLLRSAKPRGTPARPRRASCAANRRKWREAPPPPSPIRSEAPARSPADPRARREAHPRCSRERSTIRGGVQERAPRARARRGIRDTASSLGASLPQCRAAVPRRISLPELKRNAPN